MNRAEIIKFLLDKSNMNISELTREMGVHRTNVYHWRDGITTPKKSTINKLSEILNIPIKWEGKDQVTIIDSPIELTEEKIDMNMDSSKIIALYDENRELRLKIDELKKSKNPESSHWDDLSFHFSTEVTLHFSGFGTLGRTINKVTDIKKQSKVLGYSEKEILKMWDIGNKHKDMNSHPINTILHNNTTHELDKIGKTLPTVFNAIKDMIGNHYIPTSLMYICKDGSYVGAISYNKVDWKNQKVYSKIAFLIEE